MFENFPATMRYYAIAKRQGSLYNGKGASGALSRNSVPIPYVYS